MDTRDNGLCECGCGEATNPAPQTYTSRGLKKGDPLRFVKGHSARGRSMHPNTRAALSRATLGVPRSAQTRERISLAKRGIPVPPERRRRISNTLRTKGIQPPAHAHTMSVVVTRELTGPLRYNWKDEDVVGYGSLHDWVQRHRSRTGECRVCGATDRRTENANLSGEYRRDLDDFLEMCVPCHREYDGFTTTSLHNRRLNRR